MTDTLPSRPDPRPESASVPPQPPRLLDVLRQTARQRGHLESTTSSFVDWSVRFMKFHGNRHPRELQIPDVGRFLEEVATRETEPGGTMEFPSIPASLVKILAPRQADPQARFSPFPSFFDRK